jgi:hypothetical protein
VRASLRLTLGAVRPFVEFIVDRHARLMRDCEDALSAQVPFRSLV